jgi:putative transposase
MTPQPKHKACRRYNDPGHAHALTFGCFRGQPFFSKPRPCHWFIESLQRARDRWNFDLWAYVIMPEHCHVLILPGVRDYSISRILESIKLPVTRRAKACLQKNAPEGLRLMRDERPGGHVVHRFWQRGGGYDRNIHEPAVVHAQIQYIHDNPVRRGLVASSEEWPWSSAAWYCGERDVPLAPDAESVPRLHPTWLRTCRPAAAPRDGMPPVLAVTACRPFPGDHTPLPQPKGPARCDRASGF